MFVRRVGLSIYAPAACLLNNLLLRNVLLFEKIDDAVYDMITSFIDTDRMSFLSALMPAVVSVCQAALKDVK